MENKKGQIMSRDDFIGERLYTKEHYEGLLISFDMETGGYNIGVELENDKVLVVDQASESKVRERIQAWASQIREIQRKHRSGNKLYN